MAKAAPKLGPPTSQNAETDYLAELDHVPVSVVRFTDQVSLPGSVTSTMRSVGHNVVTYIPRMRCFYCVHAPPTGPQSRSLIPMEKAEWFRF